MARSIDFERVEFLVERPAAFEAGLPTCGREVFRTRHAVLLCPFSWGHTGRCAVVVELTADGARLAEQAATVQQEADDAARRPPTPPDGQPPRLRPV